MLKYLKRDLINASIEPFLSFPIPDKKYAEESRQEHEIADGIIKSIEGIAPMQYLAVVQGLFEGGFLSVEDRDFNCEQLFNYVYGVKVYHALDAFKELHTKLTAIGMTDHTDCDKTYNTSGDNFFSAYTFNVLPTKKDFEIRKLSDNLLGRKEQVIEDDLNWTEAKRRIIIVENQSPMFAYILEDNVFSGKAERFHIVQLKRDYMHDSKLTELIKCEFNITNNYDWSPRDDTRIQRIITTLNIKNMECNPVIEPRHIEYALFNIYSGRDCLEEKDQDNER